MKLYNSLTRKKETFVPINEGEVKMYVCGPTVYNYFHIGNARPFMMFDILRGYMEYRGLKVTYVQNFTDVDDKIINKANEEGVSSLEISEQYIDEYFKDADALGIKRATVHPKVTETMDEIIAFIEVLVEKKFAYEVGGDVYFDTKNYSEYGKLSKQSIDDLVSGARVEVNDAKKNSVDFALWKKHKPGEPFWESPWGQGRPGWHIECSVMSTKYLGETIDIHAGGQDLIFPHHENEIAQSEAYSGKQYVNYWVHNGYINIDNQKMSKSKGNFFTVRDILNEYDSEVIRFFMIQAQYRNPINFSRDLIESAQNGLERLYNAKENINHLMDNVQRLEMTESEQNIWEGFQDYKVKYIEAMDDDLNTADAVAAIFELVKAYNTTLTVDHSKELLEKADALLSELAGVLGILNKKKVSIDDEIDALIKERTMARQNKDWATADRIRDELAARNIVLEDTPQGIKWSYKK